LGWVASDTPTVTTASARKAMIAPQNEAASFEPRSIVPHAYGSCRQERAQEARDQPPEPRPWRRPPPEHGDDERGEERRVEVAEQQLDAVHDVVVALGDERRGYRDQQADERGLSPDAQVVLLVAVRADVVLPQVVGDDRVEGRDVGRDAAHERRQQPRHGEREHALGEVGADEQRDRVVVLEVGVAAAEPPDRDQGDEAGDDRQRGMKIFG
jgi:hypothetical protein